MVKISKAKFITRNVKTKYNTRQLDEKRYLIIIPKKVEKWDLMKESTWEQPEKKSIIETKPFPTSSLLNYRTYEGTWVQTPSEEIIFLCTIYLDQIMKAI